VRAVTAQLNEPRGGAWWRVASNVGRAAIVATESLTPSGTCRRQLRNGSLLRAFCPEMPPAPDFKDVE
jgi:hypothetical protein